MKTILYFKSDSGYNFKLHTSTKFDIRIQKIAPFYKLTGENVLYEVSSSIVDESYLIEKFNFPNKNMIWLSKIEAHLFGKEIEPDTIIKDINNEDTPYSFSLLDLDEAKEFKTKELNAKTSSLICEGFDYDGHTFGASLYDQVQWNSLSAIKNDLVYPIENTVKDINDDYYTVDKASDLTNLILAGMGVVVTKKNNGKILKDQVKNKTTIQDVFDVVDDR